MHEKPDHRMVAASRAHRRRFLDRYVGRPLAAAFLIAIYWAIASLVNWLMPPRGSGRPKPSSRRRSESREP